MLIRVTRNISHLFECFTMQYQNKNKEAKMRDGEAQHYVNRVWNTSEATFYFFNMNILSVA